MNHAWKVWVEDSHPRPGPDASESDRECFGEPLMTVEGTDPREAAEEAAVDYYNNHDGWESHWPVTFTVEREDTGEVFDVAVELEFEPVFYGGEAKVRR